MGPLERIFGVPRRQASFLQVWSRRMPLGWAAVLALSLGSAGFVLGNLSEHTPPAASSVEVRIVEAASAGTTST